LINPTAVFFQNQAGNVPHPELTEQQRQHIKERCMSPTTYYNAAGVPIRPFLTRGSVAERVLIFEKCPTEVRDRSGNSLFTTASSAVALPASAAGHHLHQSHRSSNGNLSTWRTNEVQSRAQVSNSQPIFLLIKEKKITQTSPLNYPSLSFYLCPFSSTIFLFQ
jgi:hypothetical protein